MRLLLLILFLPCIAFSQFKNKNIVLKYLSQDLEITTKNKAVFYGVSQKSGDHWFLYALYSDTTPVLKAYYKDKNLEIKDGPFIVYFPKNRKAKEGFYHENSMYSVWRDWYENGQLKDSGEFKNDLMIGQWKSYYENGTMAVMANYADVPGGNSSQQSAQETRSIRQGKFTTWYRNGNLESTGNYENNLLQGEWKWFHENGKPSTVEIYKNGKLDGISCYDTTGTYTGENCSALRPALLKYYGDYRQFISEHLTWPPDAIIKNIQGNVHVKFRISKEGQLKDLVIEGGHKILQEAVKGLFSKMTEWDPAVSHNRFIDTIEEVNIPFVKR